MMLACTETYLRLLTKEAFSSHKAASSPTPILAPMILEVVEVDSKQPPT